jgi:hypothetical protein
MTDLITRPAAPRRLSGAELSTIAGRFPTHLHSFFALRSAHGFSLSEMAEELGMGERQYHLLDGDAALVSLQAHPAGYLRIQLCGGGAPAEALGSWLAAALARCRVNRAVSMLFSEEACERAALERLGFVQEAVLREHVFSGGGYRDVLVFGLVEDAP